MLDLWTSELRNFFNKIFSFTSQIKCVLRKFKQIVSPKKSSGLVQKAISWKLFFLILSDKITKLCSNPSFYSETITQGTWIETREKPYWKKRSRWGQGWRKCWFYAVGKKSPPVNLWRKVSINSTTHRPRFLVPAINMSFYIADTRYINSRLLFSHD